MLGIFLFYFKGTPSWILLQTFCRQFIKTEILKFSANICVGDGAEFKNKLTGVMVYFQPAEKSTIRGKFDQQQHNE